MALVKNGMGVPEAPLVMSGGVYASWIWAPEWLRESWMTRHPQEIDRSQFDEGKVEQAREVLADAMGLS